MLRLTWQPPQTADHCDLVGMIPASGVSPLGGVSHSASGPYTSGHYLMTVLYGSRAKHTFALSDMNWSNIHHSWSSMNVSTTTSFSRPRASEVCSMGLRVHYSKVCSTGLKGHWSVFHGIHGLLTCASRAEGPLKCVLTELSNDWMCSMGLSYIGTIEVCSTGLIGCSVVLRAIEVCLSGLGDHWSLPQWGRGTIEFCPNELRDHWSLPHGAQCPLKCPPWGCENTEVWSTGRTIANDNFHTGVTLSLSRSWSDSHWQEVR